jgi:hypothetical protein
MKSLLADNTLPKWVGLNPPENVCWIALDFWRKLKELPDWFSFLEDGYTLYAGTAREVEKYLDPTLHHERKIQVLRSLYIIISNSL